MATVGKTLLACVVLIYLVLVLSGRIKESSKLGWPEFALIVLVVLFAGGFFDKLAKLTIGEKGVELTLEDIRSRQRIQQSDLTEVKIALRGLVTKYEYWHLERLNSEGPYEIKYGNKLFDEITRLDDIRYIQPTAMNPGGFVVIRDQYSSRPGVSFDLKEYMQITNDGKSYLQARGPSG